MMKPTIHLNGTSGRTLLDGYMNACEALRTAIKTCSEAGPNGRDYYPQGGNAIGLAISEHVTRMDALRKLLSEFEELGEHVVDNINRR